MRIVKIVCLLIVLVIPGEAKEKREQYRDFSVKGPEYQLLGNLRLALPDIVYAGAEQVEIFGTECLASKYTTTVEVEVQALCAIGPNGGKQVYELCPANYEIHIIQDSGRRLHDTLIQEIYKYWSRKELCTNDHCFDFNIQGKEYILSIPPSAEREGCFYLFWSKERLVKITFKGFQSGGGWGPLSAFTSDVLRIRLEDKEVKAYQIPLHPQPRFLKLYREGFFRQ